MLKVCTSHTLAHSLSSESTKFSNFTPLAQNETGPRRASVRLDHELPYLQYIVMTNPQKKVAANLSIEFKNAKSLNGKTNVFLDV